MKTVALAILFQIAVLAQWSTFGGDPQRSGWARKESILDKTNASTLEVKWKLKLDNIAKELTSLTPPVVVDQVKTDRGIKEYVIVGGSSDNLYAIDADTGKLVWKKTFTVTGKPAREPNGLCPFALNATPVIQDGRPKTIYSISIDGRLHALNAANGEDRFAPMPFVPGFSKNWSLNLAGGMLYTAIGQGCNGVTSGVYAVDLNAPDRPVYSFLVGRPGIWGRGGVALSTESGKVFGETGDGTFKPEEGQYADSFIALSTKDLKLLDYYTPTNRQWLTRKDLDMGCITPVVFQFEGKEYLAGGGKEGRLYLLDTASLGGETHRQPLVRTELLNNENASYSAHGFWGSFATWEDPKKTRWLYAPAWGPPHPAAPAFAIANGEAPHGSIMAFKVESKAGLPVFTPAWISRDLNVPEPPIIANGVVWVLSSGEEVHQADASGRGLGTADRIRSSTKAVLYGFDAETGKELYSSQDLISSFTHFGGIAISNGRVFVTAFDGTVYAFGSKNEER